MRRTLALLAVAAVALSILALPGPEPAAAATRTLRIGVLSSDLADNYPLDSMTRTRSDRVYNMLVADLGAQHTVVKITDDDVRSLDRLSQYDCVVFVRQIPLDSLMRNTIRDYVARGGGVVGMFGLGRTDYASGAVPPYAALIHRWAFPNYGYQWLYWEWGEMSEVYQVAFVNDARMNAGYRASGAAPGAHPILAACASDLGRSAALSVVGKVDYNEIVSPYPGNASVTRLLTYTSANVGNGTAAAWATNYGRGRMVYYGFQLYDLAQAGDVQARALMRNSVKWAGDPGLLGASPTYGSQMKTPSLGSSASFSKGVVRVNGAVSNGGISPLRGYFLGELRDPSGTRRGGAYMGGNRISLKSGTGYANSVSVSAGTRPTAGRWTARIGYEYYDACRGGDVWIYRDIYLDSNGSAMRYAGARLWYSAELPPAGPGIVGADRYAVAASISATGWPSGPGANDAVVLATGLKFSDALAASPLAGKLDAPILLTPRTSLSPYTAAELRRMYTGRDHAVIYAVGSAYYMPGGVVNAARATVQAVLNTSGTVEVRLIGGADDFALARSVATQVGAPTSGPFANTAIIASYSAFADALSMSPLAAKHGIPILFVSASTIPLATQQALAGLGIKHCIIAGGPGTVGPAVEWWLESKGYRGAGVADNSMSSPDTRLWGATRYDVSANAARYGVAYGGMDGSGLFVASGLVWPDALAAGPLGGKQSHPVLLVQGRDLHLSPPSASYLGSRRDDPPAVTFFGGFGTIPAYTRSQVGFALGLN